MSNKMFHKFILQQRKDIENYIKDINNYNGQAKWVKK